MQPAITDLVYEFTPSSGTFTGNIDIAKGLSTVNRRLYKQGMNYAVSGVSIARIDNGITNCVLYTAGNTWMVHNAWKKGKALWDGQQKEAAKAVGIKRGKWSDFKVTLDDVFTTATLNPRNSTTGGSSADPQCDEWAYSELVWEDDGDEYTPIMHLLGTSTRNTAVGLVQEYHISRTRGAANVPTIDADASESIYAKMALMGSDEFSDALIDEIEGDNDAPPYDQDEMYGGDTAGDHAVVVDHFVASSAATGRSVPLMAPCGLLRFKVVSVESQDANQPHVLANSDEAHTLIVHLAPGGYKGVLAEPMGQ